MVPFLFFLHLQYFLVHYDYISSYFIIILTKIIYIITTEQNNKLKSNIREEEQFERYIKNIENEETKLLKLQKQYRNGDIKEKDLTQIQIKALCDLYDRQIESLKKSNEYRKQKLLINKQKTVLKNDTNTLEET